MPICVKSPTGEDGHPAERKILVHVVVEPEAEREGRIVSSAGPESQVGVETPSCFLRVCRSRWFRG